MPGCSRTNPSRNGSTRKSSACCTTLSASSTKASRSARLKTQSSTRSGLIFCCCCFVSVRTDGRGDVRAARADRRRDARLGRGAADADRPARLFGRHHRERGRRSRPGPSTHPVSIYVLTDVCQPRKKKTKTSRSTSPTGSSAAASSAGAASRKRSASSSAPN